MSYIHARKRGDEMVYRYWGNSGGAYYTPEMNLEQMVRWLVEDDVERVLMSKGRELEERLKRANRKGTSCRISAADEKDDPWRESEVSVSDDLRMADAEEYIGGTMTFFLDSDKPLIKGKVVRVKVTVEMVEDPISERLRQLAEPETTEALTAAVTKAATAAVKEHHDEGRPMPPEKNDE